MPLSTETRVENLQGNALRTSKCILEEVEKRFPAPLDYKPGILGALDQDIARLKECSPDTVLAVRTGYGRYHDKSNGLFTEKYLIKQRRRIILSELWNLSHHALVNILSKEEIYHTVSSIMELSYNTIRQRYKLGPNSFKAGYSTNVQKVENQRYFFDLVQRLQLTLLETSLEDKHISRRNYLAYTLNRNWKTIYRATRGLHNFEKFREYVNPLLTFPKERRRSIEGKRNSSAPLDVELSSKLVYNELNIGHKLWKIIINTRGGHPNLEDILKNYFYLSTPALQNRIKSKLLSAYILQRTQKLAE